MYKKVIYYGLVIVAMFVLLYLMVTTYNEWQKAQEQVKTPISLLTAATIYSILFGILIECRRLLLLFQQGIKVNWLIIVTCECLFYH
ncbi:hypothetical protein [Virgibacillus doumboii]|uniref:hypothetical protein n=1 Tax=Virgibacillus doumboii TaxID=2697503 RepID=UPI0013E01C0D|nr:hypothetical protein [Virgibacillus doumboii]